MTDEQKYNELLKGIGELLQEKNNEIWMKDYEICDLKKKLAEAEKVIAEKIGSNGVVKIFETR